MFERPYVSDLINRFENKSPFIQIIQGPRQVGKTTAIKQFINRINIPYRYALADIPTPLDHSWLEAQWHSARALLSQKGRACLILDEIQKIPDWQTTVKRLFDEDKWESRDLFVILLGSSSLLIDQGASESLTGRFEILRFPHWSWIECKNAFDLRLEEYLFFGGYPGALAIRRRENDWAQYIRDSIIEPVISKDILLISRVDKPILLRKLFMTACEYSGQILSYNKMLGQFQDVGNSTTIAHYQNLLERSFLIKGLQKYSSNLLQKRNSSPKWIVLNTAFFSAVRNIPFSEFIHDPQSWGRLTETSLIAHCISQGLSSGIETLYWRDHNMEVDLILKKGTKLIALEIKSGRKPTSLSGLTKFQKLFPETKIFIIGDQGIGIQKFLETPLENLFM